MTPIKCRIWTSSHGNDNHYFPKELSQLFQNKFGIDTPIIDSRPGRLFNDEFMTEFEANFHGLTDPQINVILMGDNDLRTHAVHGAQRTQENTKKIINLHKNTPHGLLIFGSLPSPATFPQTAPLANFLDDQTEDELIKLLCSDPQAYGRIGFVHTSVLFSKIRTAFRCMRKMESTSMRSEPNFLLITSFTMQANLQAS